MSSSGNLPDNLKFAHALDLQGPALTVQSACSSSLAAIMIACDAIHNNRCSAAIAGGASMGFPLDRYGLVSSEGKNGFGLKIDTSAGAKLHNMFSGDSTCRAYDKDSKGTAPGCGSAWNQPVSKSYMR